MKILELKNGRVRIQRYNRTWVQLRRFHRDYEPEFK